MDGQTERVNQCLEMYLRCVVFDVHKKWKSWLAQAEFWYNTLFHTALGCSPFGDLYWHEPNLGTLTTTAATTIPELDDHVQHLQLQIVILKEHLARAQNRKKMYADRKRSNKEFQVGDSVLLKLQPDVQSSLVKRPCPKLAFKYFGPY